MTISQCITYRSYQQLNAKLKALNFLRSTGKEIGPLHLNKKMPPIIYFSEVLLRFDYCTYKVIYLYLLKVIICSTVSIVCNTKQVVYFTNYAYFDHPITVNLKSAKWYRSVSDYQTHSALGLLTLTKFDQRCFAWSIYFCKYLLYIPTKGVT